MRFALHLILLLLGGTLPQSPVKAEAPLPEVEKQRNGDVTLLLIPCKSCRWKSWETFMQRNRDRYTMYAVTLPGFGGTPRPDLPVNTPGAPWRENALEQLSSLMAREEMREVVLMTHSFGTMVGVQLAARHPDRFSRMINLDGSLTYPDGTTWQERLADARKVVEAQSLALADAERWRRFNGGQPDTSMPLASEPVMPRHRAILYHGMFMATDRTSLIQYWRENPLIDLNAELRKLRLPILDIQAMRGGDYEEQKHAHLDTLKKAGSPDTVQTIFLEDTSHFVMEHRPQLLDRIVADFVAGRKVEPQ